MKLVNQLQERAKELQCLYNVDEVLKNNELPLSKIFYRLLEIIPYGWQFPGICKVRIVYENQRYTESDFTETKWFQVSELIVDNNIVGEIQIFYTSTPKNSVLFLPEEQKLLNTIANRLSNYVFHMKLEQTLKLFTFNPEKKYSSDYLSVSSDYHWKWRMKMAKKIAEKTDFAAFGIEAMYIIGSTKENKAGPASDIDILVHTNGNDYQKDLFKLWIEGWSHSLAEMNWQNTGHILADGIIDLHIITDEDIKKKTSFAVMVTSIENSAHLLRSKK